MPGRLRNFVFTLNNYKEPDDLDRLKALPVRYLLVAREVGESGTPHYQGYCELSKQMAFDAVHKALDKRAHLAPRNGTQEQAINYCKKGEQDHAEWKERGTLGPMFGSNLDIAAEVGAANEQGKRTDLTDVIEQIVGSKRIADVAADNAVAFIKYAKGIQTYYQLLDKPRNKDDPLDVIVHYGPTGTGKTYKALSDNPEAFKYSIGCHEWFDGYDRHEVVVMDEYRGTLQFGMLLQLLDVYPLKVQVKGGFREWKPNKVIITSPVHPALWYSPETLAKKDGSINQLIRRINKIYYFAERDKIYDHTDKDWHEIIREKAAGTAEDHTAFA